MGGFNCKFGCRIQFIYVNYCYVIHVYMYVVLQDRSAPGAEHLILFQFFFNFALQNSRHGFDVKFEAIEQLEIAKVRK